MLTKIVRLFGRECHAPKSVIRFIDKLEQYHNRHPEDLCEPETEDREVVACLKDAFLGEGWYCAMPMNGRQVNTVILDNILYKHCEAYRKECAKRSEKRKKL